MTLFVLRFVTSAALDYINTILSSILQLPIHDGGNPTYIYEIEEHNYTLLFTCDKDL